MKILESQDQNTFIIMGNKTEMRLIFEMIDEAHRKEINKIKRRRFYAIKHFLDKNLCVF